MVGKRSKSGKGIGMGKAEYDDNDNLRMKKQSRTVKAGLQFSVPRIHRKLKQGRYGKRIRSAAPVYLAAVLEYLIAEVLELSGNAAHENRKRRIIPRYLQLAIRNDAELDKLLGSVIVSEGGVVPHIMPQLLPTTRSKAKSQRSQEV